MYPSLFRRIFSCLMFIVLFVCIPDTTAQEVPKKTLLQMTEDERQALVMEMQRVIDNAMIGAHFFSEDPLPVHVEVSVDPATNLVVLNVDERLGPDALTGEFDDFASHLSNALWMLMERIDGVTGIDFRFGGFDADHWPINRRPEPSTEGRRQRRSDPVHAQLKRGSCVWADPCLHPLPRRKGRWVVAETSRRPNA